MVLKGGSRVHGGTDIDMVLKFESRDPGGKI